MEEKWSVDKLGGSNWNTWKFKMKKPEGYVKPGEEHLVCKPEKSLYGLKQSSRCWNKAFGECIENIDFTKASADPYVFIRREKDTLTIIGVHVDDLMILAKQKFRR